MNHRTAFPNKTVLSLLAFSTCLIIFANVVEAHRVNVFAWVEGDRVRVEGKFAGGKTVKNGQVIVTDSAGTQLLEGRTDENGEFSFKIPQSSDLKITLIAGMGHQAEWTIPRTELAAAATPQNAPGSNQSPQATIAESPKTEAESGLALETHAPVELSEIEAVVDKALDEKLAPLFKMVAESRQSGPSMQDIIGGIGYILGLVGIAAYLSRNKKND